MRDWGARIYKYGFTSSHTSSFKIYSVNEVQTCKIRKTLIHKEACVKKGIQ